MVSEPQKLSTSALARKLELPVQLLFTTLMDYGWIERTGDAWTITAKGEFEGGTYQSSRRFGRYIVWPLTLEQHPLLAAIETNKRITGAAMRRYYPRLDARQINRALGELGLQQHSILGWELTALGRSLGGQQDESQSSGAFYVSWPHEIIDHPVIHRELTAQSDQIAPPAAPADTAAVPDLFSTSEQVEAIPCGIDGHILTTKLEMRVCNWLYLAQLAHAYQRALPVEESLYADFYLPLGSVYIDCWGKDVPADQLASKLRKRDIYKAMDLHYIEINSSDVEKLDEVLGRGLLAYGIRC